MEPQIETLKEKKLVGKRLTMSLVNNRTHELWQYIMPRRKDIPNKIGADLYSIEVYDDTSYFTEFNPGNEFEKWAAVEVSDFDNVPAEMETLVLPSGLYAIFLYKGLPSEGRVFYQYIYSDWLPASAFQLDNRPHFALMGDKYKNGDPKSEELIWIPVKPK